LVYLHGPGAPDALLDDQPAAGQAIDFPHHRRGINVEGPGEVGQRPSFVLVEEQLDEQTALCVAPKDRKWVNILHQAQHIMRNAQKTYLFLCRPRSAHAIGRRAGASWSD
jgi:hypothetical protein